MSVDREELKKMIDQIPEQDALEVYDFIGYLNMKRERTALRQLDVASLADDADLIRQVQQSREDREHGRIYGKEAGLEYLRTKVKEFEHGQNV
ncbi:hypothetical protein E1757_18095 [Paenibacillus piri]|uniref:DUF2281 domain-containing protein n=2 Tax=Paenibacillus piri TaxID=2547395 RepID=A0A4V2ZT97_9BACL|nr:hypothetical protein E1757_18095 [Paenibacillus piri]